MNNIKEQIKSLKIDEFSSGIFILLSVSTILGDKLVEKYYKTNNKKDYVIAKKIFIISLVITLLLYLYFLKNNKDEYYEKIKNNEESFPNLIRLIGSILLVAGIICFIYFQVKDNELTGVVPL